MSQTVRWCTVRRLGSAAIGLSLGLVLTAGVLAAPAGISFQPVAAQQGAELALPDGFSYRILVSQGDQLRDGNLFGRMPDFTGYLPLDGSRLGQLWVSHETRPAGGSVLTVGRTADGAWQVVGSEAFDFSQVGGAWNLCAGSVTPWETILVAEEYPPAKAEEIPSGLLADPARYGWIVEVDLERGSARKLYGMGRFSHESAIVLPDRKTVFLADDYRGGIFAKFVADRPGDLTEGQLFAADLQGRRWIPVPRDRAILEKVREWAVQNGATPLDRPEDIAYDPADGQVYLAITGDNAKEGQDAYGQVLRVDPETLDSEPFVLGGPQTGLFNPDNLEFDPHGNLWVFEDKYGDFINAQYGNNHIWVADAEGALHRFASIPNGAEGTGPAFTPDGKTLFFSVQHPSTPWRSSVVAVQGF
ncbi:PhoX family protein [Limnochorda pilosa]|uniref:DUF839 domain-containing protein n=1 Tax=Limnochorda pilosa TaxID=1555112 RepID=A0A0K2SJA3_LIMPI|nr:alkaline phosphatase PhoX [Limnochorda pilosa]BAS27173.1 hypothetical protein LIP_1321 [Limnochorda pilosa]